jgi:glycosyltransferase involved in cell wall biosynthesis
MGGQKGIALFNQSFCKEVDFFCATTRNNVLNGRVNYPLVSIFGNAAFRYINPLLYFRIRKIIRKHEITHLLLEHPYLGWLGWLIKKTTRIKIVIHSHNIEAERFRSTGKWWWHLLKFYEGFTHRMADFNYFISDEDRKYALEHYGLSEHRCTTITYGFDFPKPPDAEEKIKARQTLCELHGIPQDHRIILFNGTLDYLPNREALDHILFRINPLLLKIESFKYSIIICGKGLPATYGNLETEKKHHILYAGFVDDIMLYFKGADIFLNPVQEGGGIKTKLVEALGCNLYCISSENGAFGIPKNITGQHLSIIPNNEWSGYVHGLINAPENPSPIPDSFFDHFYWPNIASKAANMLKQ